MLLVGTLYCLGHVTVYGPGAMADIPNVQQNSLMCLVPWTTGTLPYIVKHAFHFIGKPDKGQNKGQKGFIVANLILAGSAWGVWTSPPIRATRPLQFWSLILIGRISSISNRAVDPQNNNFSLDDDVGIRESHSNMAGYLTNGCCPKIQLFL